MGTWASRVPYLRGFGLSGYEISPSVASGVPAAASASGLGRSAA